MASVQETFITLKLKVYYTLDREQGVNVSAHRYSEHKTCLSNTFEIYIESLICQTKVSQGFVSKYQSRI